MSFRERGGEPVLVFRRLRRLRRLRRGGRRGSRRDARGFTQQQLASLDAKLIETGSITVAEMRRRYSRQYQAVLKRGRIRNETEFYLVKGILDSCADSLGQHEQATLDSLLLGFEQSS